MTSTASDTSELTLLKLPRRRDVDGMRGIAVLAVLGYHFLPEVFRSGLLGVDVFFVISGYVITNLLVHEIGTRTFSIVHFWMFRIRRLFPALLAVLATALVAGWFILWPIDYQHLGAQIVWSAAFMGNVGQLRNSSYFDGGLIEKPLAHLWSLGVEEQFYLAWPLMLALLVAIIALRRVLPATIGLIALSWLACLVVGQSNPTAAFFLPWFRAWELLMGAAIAVLLSSRPPSDATAGRRRAVNLASTAALSLLIVTFAVPFTSQNPAVYALLTVALTSAVILLGGHSTWTRSLLTPRWLLWFGAISYPLYLWHWLVLSMAIEAGAPRGNYAVTGLLVGASVLAAWLTSRYLEAPFRRRAPSRGIILGLLAAMAAVTVAAGAVVYFQGFPDRLSGMQRQLSDYTYDYATAYRLGTCFVEEGTSLAPDCLRPSDGTPRIMLWGDSHAAHLYPGLATREAGIADIEQATTSSCHPDLPDPAIQSATCAESNARALDYATSTSPDVILIAADWPGYDPARLSALLTELRTRTTSKVVVVGPVPRWTAPLPQALANSMSPGQDTIPDRSWELVDGGYEDVDSSVRATAQAAGAGFLDTRSVLCTTDGCLTYTALDPLVLTAWDEAHLTTAGSELVADALKAAGLLSTGPTP